MIERVRTEDPRARAIVSHAVGLDVLRRCADALASADVPVMPLKGLWLQSWVYARPEERLITDVDVIVPEALLPAARTALERTGFVARQGNASEVALWHEDLALPIDLHRRLFMPGAFTLPTAELFERGRAGVLGGVPVTLPDPIDGLCHLIGHFVKSRSSPSDAASTRDFAEVLDRFALPPEEVAMRIERAGMARAARFALHEVAKHDRHLRAVLASLPRDPLGGALATGCAHIAELARDSPHGPAETVLARRLAQRLARGPAGALTGFLLERSIAAGARALAHRVASLPQDRAYVPTMPATRGARAPRPPKAL